MRVKLQYSVELEEVPDVAANLIEDEADRLSYCDHAIQSIVESLKQEEPHISFVIDKIDKGEFFGYSERYCPMEKLVKRKRARNFIIYL